MHFAITEQECDRRRGGAVATNDLGCYVARNQNITLKLLSFITLIGI